MRRRQLLQTYNNNHMVGEPLEHPYHWKMKYTITPTNNTVDLLFLMPYNGGVSGQKVKFSEAIIIKDNGTPVVFSTGDTYNGQAFNEYSILLGAGEYTIYYLPIYTAKVNNVVVPGVIAHGGYGAKYVDTFTSYGYQLGEIITYYIRPAIDYKCVESPYSVVNLFRDAYNLKQVDLPVPFSNLIINKTNFTNKLEKLRVPLEDLESYKQWFADNKPYVVNIIEGYEFTLLNEDGSYPLITS